MAEERIIGSRHAAVRALCLAGMLSDGPVSYYRHFKRLSLEENVPHKTRVEILMHLAGLARAKGHEISTLDLQEPGLSDSADDDSAPKEETSRESGPVSAEISPASEEDLAIEAALGEMEDYEFGFDEPEPNQTPGSPLVEFVRATVKQWLEKKDFRFLWRPLSFEGQDYYLVATWRLRKSNPTVEWTVTGTTGNNSVLHKCGADVLHFENDSAVCINEECVVSWSLPPADKDLFKDSNFAGTRQEGIEATAFFWLLKYVPGREFRFWMNEEPSKRPPKRDIWKKRLVMAQTLPKLKA